MEKINSKILRSHKISVSDSQNPFSQPIAKIVELISVSRINEVSLSTGFQEVVRFLTRILTVGHYCPVLMFDSQSQFCSVLDEQFIRS